VIIIFLGNIANTTTSKTLSIQNKAIIYCFALIIRCFSANATQIVKEQCEGQTACWPDVSVKVFGDLKVDFDCVPIRNYYEAKEPGKCLCYVM